MAAIENKRVKKPVLKRHLWLLVIAIGLLGAGLVAIFDDTRLEIGLYNNSGRNFQSATVSLGGTHWETGTLIDGESVARSFPRSSGDEALALYIDADTPLQWSAPNPAGGDISRITLRVDSSGSIMVTREHTWYATLLRLLQ